MFVCGHMFCCCNEIKKVKSRFLSVNFSPRLYFFNNNIKPAQGQLRLKPLLFENLKSLKKVSKLKKFLKKTVRH